MSRLALVLIGEAGADARPNVPPRHAARVSVVEAAGDDVRALAGAVESADADFVCLGAASVRLLEDGLSRTLDALAEPALPVAADGWIHRSMFVLCEGVPPTSRETRRLTLGEGSRAATPAAVLGGAMAQPGALVAARGPLLEILARGPNVDHLADVRGPAAVTSAVTRALGGAGRLMLMPWVLSERLVLRTSEEMDLGDAIGIDAAHQFASAELWRSSWFGSDDLAMAQLRMVHALDGPPPRRSPARRAASRLRRALR